MKQHNLRIRTVNIFISLICLVMLYASYAHAATQTTTSSSTASHVNQDWQLLLFTIPGCSSCVMMREQVIEPMISAGIIQANQFEEVVQRRDADWQYVRGIGYKQIRELKTTYQTSLFPTLVAVDLQGNRLTENIVGMTSIEHYRKLMDILVQKLHQR